MNLFGLGKDAEKVTLWMLEEDQEAATLTVTVLHVLHSVADLDIVRTIKIEVRIHTQYQ